MSGNGNDGQLNGNPTFIAGVTRNALSLDGIDDHMVGPGPLTNSLPFTWASWFKINATGAGASGPFLSIQAPPSKWSPNLAFTSNANNTVDKAGWYSQVLRLFDRVS